jgi:hypothetical protein
MLFFIFFTYPGFSHLGLFDCILLNTLELNSNTSGNILPDSDSFGRSVVNMGDLDGTGVKCLKFFVI